MAAQPQQVPLWYEIPRTETTMTPENRLKLYMPNRFSYNNVDISINDMAYFRASNLPPLTDYNTIKYIRYDETLEEDRTPDLTRLELIFINLIDFLQRLLQVCLMCSSESLLMSQRQRQLAHSTCCGHSAPTLAFMLYLATLFGEEYVRQNYYTNVKAASCFYRTIAYNTNTTALNLPANLFYYALNGTNLLETVVADNFVSIFSIYCNTTFATYHHFIVFNKWINDTMYVMIFDTWVGGNGENRDIWGRIMKMGDFRILLNELNQPIIFENDQQYTIAIMKKNILYESYFSIPHTTIGHQLMIQSTNICYNVGGFYLHNTPNIRPLVNGCLIESGSPQRIIGGRCENKRRAKKSKKNRKKNKSRNKTKHKKMRK